MATIRREITLDQPADLVWSVVTRVDLLHLWFPGLVDCTMATGPDGAVRTVHLASGITMDEHIVVNDTDQRRLQYSITSPPLRSHLGVVDVIELSESSCLVVYSCDATPNPMALVIGGACGGALEELARQFAAGDGPVLRAVGISTAAAA